MKRTIVIKKLNSIVTKLEAINNWIGRLIAPATILMMLLTCLVVIARYMFNVGTIPVQESITYLHGIVFMLGIAYTLQHGGHVRVDILYQHFSIRNQAITNLLGSVFFLLPFSIFIFWTSLGYVAFSWSFKETSSEPGGLPFVYLLKTTIPIFASLLFIQGISDILKNSITIIQQREVK